MKTTIRWIFCCALVGVSALHAQELFTRITEGPLVNTASDTWYGHWGDYDNDGRLDVIVKGGPGHWRLFHNDGGTSFSPVTNGVMGENDLRSMWAIWTDPDNDGDLDAWVWGRMGDGRAAMHWNNGSGDFTRVVADGGWIEGYQSGIGPVSSWGDFDGDGFLDAFLNFGTPGTPRLLHNNGDRTFAFVADSVLNSLDDQTQVSGAVDYDNDGDLDLIPVRYGGEPTRFYRNDGHGNFEEATPEPIRSELTHSLISAWDDIDNDGDLDVIFGGWNWLSERFYLNNGDGTFTPWAGQPALFESYSDQFGSYHDWGDFDNDGYLDLVVSKGDSALRLWRNQGDGNFTAVDAGDLTGESGSFVQSCGWVDFNEDGNLDLFVATLGGGIDKLFMGDGNGNNWLEVKPKGVASNRLAIGARIFATATIRGQVMRQMRLITASDSDQTLIAHFGLGDATKVDTLRIEWPSGIVQEIANVLANQVLSVTEHQEGATTAPSLAMSNLTDGAVQLTATGQADLRYVFEASTDLAQWTKLAVRTNLTGTVSYTPPISAAAQRFYRVVVP